jgi:hypothetical protein
VADGDADPTIAGAPRCVKVSISKAQANMYSTVMTATAPPTRILARREKRGDRVADDMEPPRRRPGKGSSILLYIDAKSPQKVPRATPL